MALYKLKDFDSSYRESFEQDILSFDLYSGNEKVGSVEDILVDETGKFRYFVINTGIWVFGKRVLLPVGRARISEVEHKIYANGLTRDQVERLPDYKEDMVMDYHQEEQVRNVYRPAVTSAGQAPLDQSVPLEQSAALEQSPTMYAPTAYTQTTQTTQPAYDQNTYSYERDPGLYNFTEQDQQTLKLYEERLIANKTRRKTGDVTVGKHVETETTRVAVPIEKERIVIERTTPTSMTGEAIAPSGDAFQAGEVVRMEVYEETPEIRKEAFVREEVSIRKEVEQETVQAKETLRREELDVDTDGNPIINDSTRS